MGKEMITFGDIEIEKHKFHRYKSPIFLEDRDVENASVSSKISAGEKSYKYFIGYLYDDNEIKPLHIMLPKMSAYVKSYDGQIKWMYFLLEDNYSLGKYNTIWQKVSASIKKN